MKKRILLSTTLCYLIAAAAMAADAPGSTPASSLQSPGGGKISGAAVVPENISGATVTAPDTYTIEGLYKNSAELNKKKVVVHGQAVKVTPGIMGKTWTHIQDGTGDKNKGTHDVICISAIYTAAVGEMVTVTGTVVFNPEKRYKLVIEDATIK